MKFTAFAGAALLLAGGLAHASPVVSASNVGADLANAIAGTGVTVSNVTYTGATTGASGFFTNGAPTVGFGSGVVLTTGTVNCIPGPNSQGGCTGGGSTTSLKFDFVSSTGKLFFNYVFASEEYNEYVNSQFNDEFQLRLNGTNIALLPGAGGVVSINNVNCGSNSAYYRNNSSGGSAGCVNQGLDIQYDGLTTVLTAAADVLVGTNTFEFLIFDRGDSSLDSGVFIQAGSFSGDDPNQVPLPGTIALLGIGFAALGAARRRKAA